MAKRLFFVLIMLSVCFGIGSAGFAGGSSQENFATKYPIMLVHGFGFRDLTAGLNYWGKVPETLAKGGVRIEYGKQNAWDTTLNGAETIWRTVNEFFAKNPSVEKLNFICHSHGAIEFRLMFALHRDDLINGKPFRDRVASFTSMCSPQRGTNIVAFIEDAVVGIVGEQNRALVGSFLGVITWFEGDRSPENPMGPLDMRPNRMVIINQNIKDMLGYDDLAPGAGLQGVYSQSWMGRLKTPTSADPTLNIGWLILATYGNNPSDGCTAENSGPYGIVRGVVSGPWWNIAGLGHQAMVGRGLLGLFDGGTPGWDANVFYTDMIKDLKSRGF